MKYDHRLESWRDRNYPGPKQPLQIDGAYRMPIKDKAWLYIIASAGQLGVVPWEHVSVTSHYTNAKGKKITRMPSWDEMCLVKDVFWDKEEAVMQLHPPASQYVNNHPMCLHLWRPLEGAIPLPLPIAVGLVNGR